MIRRVIVLGAIALCFVQATQASAITLKGASAAMEKAMPSITNDFRTGAVTGDSSNPVVPKSFGQPYRAYGFDNAKFNAKLRRGETRPGNIDFSTMVTRDYSLVYPLLDVAGRVVSSVELYQDKGVWAEVSYPGYLPPESVQFAADRGEINRYLAQQGIKKVTEVKRVSARELWVDFIYVKAATGEYIIPLQYRSDLKRLDLEHKKVYPAGEVLNRIADESAQHLKPMDNTYELLRDGYPLTVKKTPNWIHAPREVDEAMRKDLASFRRDLGENVSFGLAYQVYGFNLPKVMTMDPDDRRDAVGSIINARYYWEYPVLNEAGVVAGTALADMSENVWESAGWGPAGALPRDLFAFSASERNIKRYAAQNGIDRISDIKRLSAEALDMDFIYIDAAGGQYLIPLDLRTNDRESKAESMGLHLKDKKIYPATEVLTKIARMDVFPASNSEGRLVYGGVGERIRKVKAILSHNRTTSGKRTVSSRDELPGAKSRKYPWFWSAVGLFALVAGGAVFGFKHRALLTSKGNRAV